MATRTKALPGAAALAVALLAGRDLRAALYTRDPPAAYTTDGEVVSAGYAPGGLPIIVEPTVDGRLIATADAQTGDATITAGGALLYDVATGRGLAVTTYDPPIQSIGAPFVLEIAGAALLRIVAA